MNEAFEKILERLILESSSCEVYKLINPNKENIAEFNTYKKCIEIVKEVAEEYNGGWLPCSVRLPDIELEKEINERGSNAVFPVLATINKVNISGEKYTTVNRAFYGCYNNDKNFYNDCCDKLDVIAWQPLPEPFKERD